MLIDSEGPLWYRGLAQHDEQAEVPHLEALVEQHQAKRIVMGHTLTECTVKPRFGGRVVLIDTGMSQVNGSHLACLLIEGDKFYTIHRGERLELPKDSGEGLAEYLRAAAALDASP